MVQFQNNFVQDLQQDIKIRQCGTIVFNADNLSNVVSVELYNGEEAYSGGGTVVGAVVCPDGATVALDGTLSGNKASITLTGDCFALPGQIGVSIQIVSGDVRTTVLKAIYNVDVSSTDTIVDPGSRITLSLAEIEAKLDEIPTILANAQTAIDGIEAQKDTMIASIASVAGQGTDTTLTQSGVAADAKATGDQVRDLKSNLVLVQSTQPTAEENRIWIPTEQGEDVEVPTYEEFEDVKSALNNGQTEVALALVEGALDGSGQVISAQNKWITNDYMELSKLACLVNNTSGNVYIDYYKYSANSYSFLGYDTVEAGSTKYVAKNGGATHIRLYINNISTSVILTRYTDTFIRQEQQKVYIAVFNEDNNFTVENGSLRVSTPEGGYGEYGTETDRLAEFRVRSSFIPVVAGTHIKITPTIPSYFGYCYYIYDEMKRAISVYDGKWSTAVGPNGDETVISDGAYIRLLFHTVPDFTQITGDAMLLNVKNCISVTTENPTIADNTVKYTDGYYLNNVGELVETEKAATTALITAVPGGKAIAVMRTKTGTKWIAGAIYDQSKNFIKRITSTDYETDGDYYVMKMILPIPMNWLVGYVRFSFGANYENFNVTMEDRMPLAKYDVKSVNHRGYQNYAPENTLIAFKLSKAVGFDWVEFDVQFTSDNIPVVLHDRSINRTAVNTDGTAISGTVNIDSISYEQALGYDYGMAFSSVYAGTKIPTFDETIKICKYLGLNARIELKEETVATSKIDSLVSIVEKYGMQNNVEWASFSHPLLNYIVENHPNYGVVYIQNTIDLALINTIDSALRTTKKVSCAVFKNNSAENFAWLSETGVMIDIYTVETDADIISADSHVFSFTTNMPIAGEVLHNKSIVV